MKKGLKRSLAAFLAVVLVALEMPTMAFATTSTSSGLAKGSAISGTDYSVTSIKEYAVSPGVTEYCFNTNNSSLSSQTVSNVLEVDTSNQYAKVVVGYGDIESPIEDSFMSVRDQCALWEKVVDEDVVGGINASFFNITTGHPTGMTVIRGTTVDSSTSRPYFVTYSDGSYSIEEAGTSLSTAASNQSKQQGTTVTVTGATAGPALLVKDGKVNNTFEGNSGSYSRGAVGIKEDGTLVIWQGDGTQAPRSVGFTAEEEAAVMVSLGCDRALQLDEGSSSTFLSQREGESEVSLRNTPSGGFERAVATSILVVSTAPADGTFDHFNITPNDEYYTPNSTVELTATGMDYSGANASSIPSDFKWQLEDSSMGTLTAIATSGNVSSAVFTSNGKTGSVVIDITSGGEVVGTATVNIQNPTSISFEKTDVVLNYEEISDLGLTAEYENEEVHLKDGDIEWEIEYEYDYMYDYSEDTDEYVYNGNDVNYPIGYIDGLLFYVTSDKTVSCKVQVTAKYTGADIPEATTNVQVGKEPSIILDGGDTDGKEYDFSYIWDVGTSTASDYVANLGDTIGIGQYKTGINNDTPNGRGGVVSAEIVSDTDEDYADIVRFGQNAIRIDYDWTGLTGTDGACVGPGNEILIDGSPTAVGAWIYIPDENEPIPWCRMQIATRPAGSTDESDWTDTYINFVTVDGTMTNGDKLQVGWNYIEADISDYVSAGTEVRINSGMLFRAMKENKENQSQDGGAFNVNLERIPKADWKGWLLVDNICFVYGINNQDTTSPEMTSFCTFDDSGMKNEIPTDGSLVLNDDTVSFYATYDDNEDEDPYATGVESAYFYVDGNYVGEGDKDNLGSTLAGVKFADGQHSVMFYLKDGYGNVTRDTRYFTIDAGTDYPTVSLEIAEDPVVNEDWSLSLTASDISQITICDAKVSVNTSYPVTDVVFPEGVEGTWSYKESTGVVTIEITSVDTSVVTSNTLAEIIVTVPSSITEGSSINVQLTEGSYTTNNSSLEEGTFSTQSQSFTIAADYTISNDTLIVGHEGTIYVTDANGSKASGVTIYYVNTEDEDADTSVSELAVLGTTDKEGKLTTKVLTEEYGSFALYAMDDEGNCSYRVVVTAFMPADVKDGTPYNVSYNISEDETSEQNISWFSSVDYSEEKAYIKYSTSSDMSSAKQVTGTSDVITYSDDGIASRVNNVRVSGLAAGTIYYYQVGDGTTWSDVDTFTTGEADPDEVNFFVLADIQEEDALKGFQNIADAIENSGKSYDFAIQTGDAVDPPRSYATWDSSLELFKLEEFHDLDWIHVIGNHELDDNGMGGISSSTAFGIVDDWYSVEYGDVYVAVLNYTTDTDTLKEFGKWLVEDANNSDCLYKIIVAHVPIYYTNPTFETDIYKNYMNYIQEAGIDFYLSGHNHSYSRTVPMLDGEENEDGIVYYICGTTGGKSYAVNEDPDGIFEIATLDFTSVYLDVEADIDHISLRAYDVDDDGNVTLLDEYTKEMQYCENDDHDFIYNRDTDKLYCTKCEYKNTMAKEKYSGFVTDEETDRKMYMVAGQATTGLMYMVNTAYYFDNDGIAYKDGTYTICGETCTLKDGVVVSWDNEDVVDIGFAGDDIGYVIYSDGSMYIEGSGEMWNFSSKGTTPWAEWKGTSNTEVEGFVTSVWISKDITSIGNYAFQQMRTLKSIEFEEGSVLESLGKYALRWSTAGSVDIVLPDSLKSIGSGALAANSSLKNVYIPDGIEYIASDAFEKDSKVVLNIALDPDGTSYAKQYAIANDISYAELLDGCELALSETSYTYSGNECKPSVTIMYNGSALKLTEGTDYTLTYSDNKNVGTATVTLTGTGNYKGTLTAEFTISKASQSFKVSASKTEVDPGKTVQLSTNGVGTVTYKSSNTAVATVDSKGVVTAVKAGTVTITATAAGDSNHNSSSATISIRVTSVGKQYTVDGLKYEITSDISSKRTVKVIGATKTSVSSIRVPSSVKIEGKTYKVTAIAEKAFYGYSKLSSVAIASGVTSIGSKAFAHCTALTKVTGCTEVTKIGSYAFYECTALKNVNNCAKVTSIGKKAFCRCTSLKRVGAETGVTSLTKLNSIGAAAFYGCSKLTEVKVPSGVTELTSKVFAKCTALTKVTGCTNLTKIGEYAFYGCSSLKNVNNCSKVTSIGKKAFCRCTSLKRVGTETGVTSLSKLKSIGSYAFYACKALTAVNIPSNVKNINQKTFMKCNSLTKVTGCKNVETIKKAAFYNCTKLTRVSGCQKVTAIDSKAFCRCTKLTRIGATSGKVVLAKVQTIGEKAFYGCTALTKVNVSSTALKSIGAYAFKNCTKLSAFTSKSTKLNSIGKQAFYGDKSLKTVTLKTTKLTSSNVKASAFKGINRSCTFKVPSSVVQKYKKAFTTAGASNSITVKKA